jgi:condensin complex subunit 3
VFVQHCIATSSTERLESALPVVTALAFRIQSTYNDLLELIQAEEEDQLLGVDDEERVKREEERCDKEFVMGEMCVLAVRLDYSDEIGRRKMFQLVREYDLSPLCINHLTIGLKLRRRHDFTRSTT